MTAVEATAIDPASLGGADARAHGPLVVVRSGRRASRLAGKRIALRTLARLEGMPLAKRAVAIKSEGRVLATGLAIVEDDCAGLFDIVTHEESRRQGHARTVVSSLLRRAWELGARHSYLQVQQDNDPARRLYAQFGFEEKYLYWYRGRPGETR